MAHALLMAGSDPGMEEAPTRSDGVTLLSREQIAMIELVARGFTDRAIARALGMSKSTAQRRLREASRSLGTASRVTLVVRALELGLIQLPRERPRRES